MTTLSITVTHKGQEYKASALLNADQFDTLCKYPVAKLLAEARALADDHTASEADVKAAHMRLVLRRQCLDALIQTVSLAFSNLEIA